MTSERLDLAAMVDDIDLACESKAHADHSPDNAPASWVVWIVQCCPRGATRLVCDPCLQDVLTCEHPVRCSRCSDVVVPGKHTVIRFERINKPPTVTH